MAKGTSQPWQQTLQEVIGEGRLDGSALREYFRPLEEWLRNENLRNQEFVGWNYDGDYCKKRCKIIKNQSIIILFMTFTNFLSVLKQQISKYLAAFTTTHLMLRLTSKFLLCQ